MSRHLPTALSRSQRRALELLAIAHRNGEAWAYSSNRTTLHERRGLPPDVLVHSGTARGLADLGLVETEVDYAGMVGRLRLKRAGVLAVDRLGLWPDDLVDLDAEEASR